MKKNMKDIAGRAAFMATLFCAGGAVTYTAYKDAQIRLAQIRSEFEPVANTPTYRALQGIYRSDEKAQTALLQLAMSQICLPDAPGDRAINCPTYTGGTTGEFDEKTQVAATRFCRALKSTAQSDQILPYNCDTLRPYDITSLATVAYYRRIAANGHAPA